MGRFHEAWDLLDISNDDFIRTTEPRHTASVRKLLETIYDAGDIYEARYEGPYCVSCEAYYTEDELVDGACPIHERPVEFHAEDNYFFKLSAYGDRLLAHIEANPDFVTPETRRNEVVSFIEGGLDDISVSRAKLTWGVPLPWDQSHVAYVWFDALINYISAAGFASRRCGLHEQWPAWAHLVGKDIIRFHAVIWPAMLMSAGLPLPRQIATHGFLLVGGRRCPSRAPIRSSPSDLVPTFGSDGYRYHFLRDVSFGPDGNFSWEGMVARYNADLANDFGNLVNRVLNLAERYRDGQVPAVSSADGDRGGAAAGRCRRSAGGLRRVRGVQDQAGARRRVEVVPGCQRLHGGDRAVETGQGRDAGRSPRRGAQRRAGGAAGRRHPHLAGDASCSRGPVGPPRTRPGAPVTARSQTLPSSGRSRPPR